MRGIDLWDIQFQGDRRLYPEDEIPAAMHIRDESGDETTLPLQEGIPYT